MNKYDDLAKGIIENVGGRENVNSLTHCITRLRFKLKDESKANTDALKAMKEVVTVMKSAGQYQVVIGNTVPEVYEAVVNQGGFQTSSDGKGPKMGIGATIIDAISGIFQPILGVFSAVGILKGVLALLVFVGVLSDTSTTYQLLYAIADGFFYFLPIVLGYTASEKFGGNKFIGMAIASALCYPTMTALTTAEPLGTLFAGTLFETTYQGTFLGIPLIMPMSGYPSSVIPIIAAVLVSVQIEKFWKKVLPDVIKTFFVPLLTLLIIVPLTYLLIGPIMSILSSLISALFALLFNFSGILAGLFLGAIWQVLVIFGLHWAIIPIAIMELGLNGSTMILSPIFAACFAQSAAVFAIIFKTRNRKLKDIAIPAFISGIFGVTEAAIYGVTLPKKKPFVISCIGAAIGGAIIGFSGAAQNNIGGLGLFALPSFIGEKGGSINGVLWAVGGMVVASAVAFILTMVTYHDEPEEGDIDEIETEKETPVGGQEELVCPIVGEVLPLSEVPDEAFASGSLGQGVGLNPFEGKVYAPCDSKVSMVFNTKHAIGLESVGGAEILIHIGINTVNLEGEFFDVKVKEGESVKQGDLLMEFDVEGIKAAGYSLISPVLITNVDEYQEIQVNIGKNISVGDCIIATA
ncbi:beta-glucoside-specific PTS transporter subunit IIABC [Lachnospiraceae bacterium OttesenSCG-928-J05]|nr:beta-glucoside-specific PTS transporter subunit IIABC [Lachnospiraceae bacterium OttesenSCG-928-J05]